MNTVQIKAKTGRKRDDYVTSWGERIIGLSRRPSDGRWRIIGTQTTYTEADERTAVERFRELTNGNTEADAESAELLTRHSEAEMKRWCRWFAEQIRERPKWIAAQCGIEQLAYLRDVQPPTPLPSLDSLADYWRENAKCSALQMKKVARALADFRAVTGAATLRDITRDALAAYEKAVAARGDGGKQQSHLISGIRRVLRFYAKKKAERDALAAVNDALAALAAFELSEPTTNADPKPIEVDDWQRLYKAASMVAPATDAVYAHYFAAS